MLAFASIALRGTADPLLDWQPSLALEAPWRWWSAAFVHYSNLHLLANLAGVALVGALGFVSRVPTRVAVAWCVAWPSTQLGLLLEPELTHYGGLSGVLHAGVALVAVNLIAEGTRAQRWLGAAIIVAMIAKVMLEAPWAGPLQHRAGWDIAIAPLAHATGLVAGLAIGLVTEFLLKTTDGAGDGAPPGSGIRRGSA